MCASASPLTNNDAIFYWVWRLDWIPWMLTNWNNFFDMSYNLICCFVYWNLWVASVWFCFSCHWHSLTHRHTDSKQKTVSWLKWSYLISCVDVESILDVIQSFVQVPWPGRTQEAGGCIGLQPTERGEQFKRGRGRQEHALEYRVRVHINTERWEMMLRKHTDTSCTAEGHGQKYTQSSCCSSNINLNIRIKLQ